MRFIDINKIKMRNLVLMFTVAIFILSGGCTPDADEEITNQTSKLVARASNGEIATRSSSDSNNSEVVIFTGNDILWFNETTREIRFRDNMLISNDIRIWRTVKFYVSDEYLFSSMIFVSDLSSSIYNSLVFYYSIMENKFYLADGYPVNVSVLPKPQEAQKKRDENMREIANEWNKFIEQMKAESKLNNN
ncbi:hypothetical protein AGMMS50239_03580 [Bacteroidia bacterium]|nr:hypothetical protein AGMMS50239_03580 [Bacteroidia bacterium]